MAEIRPFAALRPDSNAAAARICELPYDVMSSAEARKLAAGNPQSFLHVSKPEIDLPDGTDLYAPEVYAKGRENFQKLIADGSLRQDPRPCFYLYRQVMGQHTQTGLVAAASCEDYLRNIIKKHELTRPDKEDDRVRHIETLNAQTGPVFLTYRAQPKLDELFAKKSADAPDIDFTAPDGVRHTAWVIADLKSIDLVQAEFARIPFLYIADGHHRCAAAARVYTARRTSPSSHPSPPVGEKVPEGRMRGMGGDESSHFLAVIFPHNQMQILPYNRVLKDLNGHSQMELLRKLERVFTIEGVLDGKPKQKHDVCFRVGSLWFLLRFREQFTATKDPMEKLDVTLLQKYVLEPLFGIQDPRTSKDINFVGGIRGVGELEKLVNSGEYACAFSMFPTGIEDLMAIADAGGIMPPKSTWFEPKLRDAMFCHLI